MKRFETIRFNPSSAAFFSAALVMLLALGWFFVAQVHAQAPIEINGQLFNGTKDASSNSVANVPVTLFQITTAGPVTRTQETDADGKFSFTNVITDANAFFTRVDYVGIRYYSEIRPPELAALTPLTMTVYETQTLPANFTVDRVHLILDVQPRRFNGLQLVQVTNPSDRAFFMPLPIPSDTSDVQFEDIRQQTIVKREADGTFLYPVLPTTSEILFGIVLPFTPPDFQLQLPLKTNVAGFNLLVSQASGVQAAGSNFVPGEAFTAQNGQVYSVFTAPEQKAGTTFRATISNLPGVDNTQQLQRTVLAVGGLFGVLLLAYPFYQRRAQKTKSAETSERVAELQTLARLDDAFERGEIPENEYYAQRAALKAELMRTTNKE